ncbi:RsmB/NOP family class I SAM-dependent RNA methyltransferase [Jannaschia pohangensis]|uniref:16S rRNA (Cytosine967-C5)-methyltransferase n=1 Tax=Jannaschia pohangensis TaxID=390807 RepID=A0A1I3GC73_9RHOB|nr:RsmB/NOP family class I SAM-dependent RNA methyltransferase [Jannaschia pohangensis]SFI21053.1 16S rRNA (cytosine967-C5)-methyltransferase [Jannaschia pohangensis]
MTPGARLQAAIEILEPILAGQAAERELTTWARGHRFAGSGDRAAIRDHVFDALRRLRSAAWAGGCGDVPLDRMEARRVIAGLIMQQGADVATLFNGQGYGPEPIDLADPGPVPAAVAADVPDWMQPLFRDSLDAEAETVMASLRDRAAVFLRVNLARTSRDSVLKELETLGHAADPSDVANTAIRLRGAPRGLTQTPLFADGLVELQDAGSQALVARLPCRAGARVLDLCAGGGGKALALADRGCVVSAHDIDADRMADLPVRAARAGQTIDCLTDPAASSPFDGVVADVPCSGSGSWRRAPEAKWRLTPARLAELHELQSTILARAERLTVPGGWIGYMTCSVFAAENAGVVDAMLACRPDLTLESRVDLRPGPDHDGFHLSVLRKNA